MTKRMLIDAAHPEETRVVIVDGTRVEELDFESRNKRQLRGNVYLAKVTRVEPSLQAAFIDYGGNRHGFLAFPEIHPDYYQLPYEDKLALQQQEEEELAAMAEAEEDDEDADDDVEEDENLDPDDEDATDENDAEVADEQVKVASKRRKRINRRRYKIQEVIKRGQILLVQAVKEERGNKGAAMTTYLSLAGRYCVLMPNTPRGGGISRKIPNGSDRKRLKKVMDGLDVPQGMGVIVRTAGAKKTKAEITRDYSYLSRLWDDIRDTTMNSRAPALIHEEGNLVKRSIRDLYNKDIEEVLVQGDEAYKTAKGFIKMLMPSHAKFVKKYEEAIPLFLRFNVEQQIENSLDATVQLKSGGYLVIHPTEALVSVDVNSGRSTKERNVERTALKTNLEAAEELARQMRLRDLAGLIVVDFIDMDENKNNRAVERKMKEVLAKDRARIQMGRISQFGLMEMSRQRRRRSLLEGSTTVCPHCDGVGRKRTVESAALTAVRALEEFAIRGKAKKIRLKCPPDVALYLLNEKRDLLQKVDDDADVFTVVEHDETLIRPNFTIEVAEKRTDSRKDPLVAIEKELREEQKKAAQARKEKAKAKATGQDEDKAETEAKSSEDMGEDETEAKPSRRRGRRGGRNRRRKSSDETKTDASTEEEADVAKADTDNDAEETKPKRRRRRRAAPKKDAETTSETGDAVEKEDTPEEETPKTRRRSSARRKAPSKSKETSTPSETSEEETDKADSANTKSDTKTSEDAPKSRRRRAAPKRKADEASVDDEAKDDKKPVRKRRAPRKADADAEQEATAQPKRRRKAPAKTKAVTDPVDDASEKASAPSKPKRTRKAPTKSKAPEPKAEASDVEAEAKAAKPKRTRKAPVKAASAAKTKASPSADDTVEESPKPKRTRKAPAKVKAPAKAKASAKAKVDDAKDASPDTEDAKPARRRKAPARKSAPASKASKDERTPAKAKAAKAAGPKADEPKDDQPETGRRRKAPARKRSGLLDRLMGKGKADE